MEVSTLVTVLLVSVFLLVMLATIIYLAKNGNIFSGEGNICERTFGFIRGCS
jgi:hypothetical protein